MPRLARAEVFSQDIVATVHVMARVVRRCFLLGTDSVTGKNYDHRKVWIEEQLNRLAAQFGIDLLCFSILSNHFHLVLRSRPDAVATWDDSEVARRWLMLCPIRKDKNKAPIEPNEFELNSVRNDPAKLAEVRNRLSNIGWWMRLLCQNIGARANNEDQEVGKFWQSRYKAVRILDEETLLACAAYVDLNPIRAAMAETIEQSDYTSVQRRIQALTEQSQASDTRTRANPLEAVEVSVAEAVFVGACQTSPARDACLSPVAINERSDPIGPHVSRNGKRCSDKGFLAMSTLEYLQVLDWSARLTFANKRGSTPPEAPPVLERLGIDAALFGVQVREFGKLFCHVAGKPKSVSDARSLKSRRRFYQRRPVKELALT